MHLSLIMPADQRIDAEIDKSKEGIYDLMSYWGPWRRDKSGTANTLEEYNSARWIATFFHYTLQGRCADPTVQDLPSARYDCCS